METPKTNKWKIVAIVALCLLLVCGTVFAVDAIGRAKQSAELTAPATEAPKATEPTEVPKAPEPTEVPTEPVKAEPLSLWTDDAPAKQALVSYIEEVTREGVGYIPPEYRIAVFDLDGTLFCETDPVYFDYCLLLYRVTQDPDYIDLASDYERETAKKIQDWITTGVAASGLEIDHGKCIASAFAGMTIREFEDYVAAFRSLPARGYEGMAIGEGFYRPMLEVVDYLIDNGFKVYIVSGTDRLIVRGLVKDSLLPVPAEQIIGSDETLVATEQGETDGLNYVFKDTDQLVLGGEFIVKNLKMNKVTVIMQEIGKQPVLSFGNSTGDASMAEFVTTDNPYPSMAFMLCCDDTVRENGKLSSAEKMASLCEQYDWTPVSMRDDWTTIYGDGVEKKRPVGTK